MPNEHIVLCTAFVNDSRLILLQEQLQALHLDCYIHREAGAISLHGPVRQHLILVNGEDRAAAERLIRDLAVTQAAEAARPPEPDWRCAQCGELSGPAFTSCWQCGADRDEW